MPLYAIWLATRQALTHRQQQAVLACFHSPEDAYYADEAAFSRVEGLSAESLESLGDKSLDQAQAILSQCRAQDIGVLTWTDEAYPARLRNISDPPLVLYYRGSLPEFSRTAAIGVVGTRKASPYGVTTAREMGFRIGRCGGIVVSGMASGIDAAATEGALLAESRPVGVLGCGVDVVYPKSNWGLYANMERYGCLLSEFPPGTPAYRWNFPQRNRIISGLSCGVLVVEAPEKSGALITARQALEQGRDVFVVPGNIGIASCEGSNGLMRDGATVVRSGWELLQEYTHLYPQRLREDSTSLNASRRLFPGGKVAQIPEKVEISRNTSAKKGKITIDKVPPQPYSDVNKDKLDLTDCERAVLAQLQNGQRLMDEVIAGTGLPSGAVLAALTMLQVKGLVALLPGKWVALR